MSAEEIQRFSDEVKNSSAMQDKLKTIGNDVDAVVAYANELGFEFSAEEVKSLSKTGTLSDEELDEVAGGQTVFMADVVGIGAAVTF